MSVHSAGQDIRTNLEDSNPVPSTYTIKDKDERSWKSYFSDVTNSSLLPPSEDCPVNSLGFLYDYYGMTEDTQHGSSSPATSESEVIQTTALAKTIDKEVIVPSKSSKQQQDSNEDLVESGSRGSPVPGNNPSSDSPSEAPGATDRQHISPRHVKTESSSASMILPSVIAAHFPQMSQSSSVFQIEDKYTYTLKAQTSSIQKQGDVSLTYLNKGQFYSLTFDCNLPNACEYGCVKSILILVFHGEKDPKNELSNWQYWHSQQANQSQRAFDVDRKSCLNIEDVEFVGYNAVAFVWNSQFKAEVVIRVNCLSTDFSSQKGVKGIPLHFQIDTYDNPSNSTGEPVHRVFCQVKIFRDKGAERKNKDESKSAEKRMVKYMKQSTNENIHASSVNAIFQCPSKETKLIPTTPLGPKPVVFVPNAEGSVSREPAGGNQSALLAQLREKETKRTMTAALTSAKEDFQDLSVLPKYKNPRVAKKQAPAVTIYVRKHEEKVYNALILFEQSVLELKDALASKYGMPAEMIKNLYKKTRKGFLVNIDDDMVEQFVDEDDFLIEVSFDNQLGHFEITFIY